MGPPFEMPARDELTAPTGGPSPARRRAYLDAGPEPRAEDAERDLARREEQLARMRRLAGFGAWEWDLGGDRAWWSDELFAILGLSAGSLEPSFEAYRRVVHPADRDVLESAIRSALERRQGYRIEHRVVRPDGEVRVVRVLGDVQVDGGGAVAGLYGLVQDVTGQVELRDAEAERARAEREARHERRRLRAIFERAPAAICITRGPSHLLMAANAAFRALLTTREIVGEPIRASLPALDRDAIAELLDRVYATGQAYVGRAVPLRHGDAGAPADRYVNLVLLPLADAEGVIEGVLLHAGDVSDMVRARLAVEEKAAELEQLTRHLEAANEELDRFAYLTSHDLRAPLRGIGNLVQWIEEDLRGDASEETRQHLALLRGRVQRLERLIDGILQYSRAGRQRDTLDTVDVGRLIEELVDLLDPPPDARIETLGAMPVLVTERVPLGQVIQNLLDNALTHGRGPEGARVRVSAERRESGWCFAVSDDGPGIEPRFHERIWRMFQTLGGAERDRAGIGLSLVRKIVEGRGGRVELESRPGHGAIFRFTWPEATQRAWRSTTGITARRSARAGNG